MSKTIVEQLAEAQSAITALTAERDNFKASLDKLTGEKATADKLAHDAAKALEDANAKAKADADALTAKATAAETAKAEAEKAKAESDAALAKLKAQVASNPAFADAGATGAKPVSDSGSPTKTMPHAEYSKLKPNEKAEFTRSGGRLS